METRGQGLERFPLQVEGPEGGDLNDKDGVGVRVGSERDRNNKTETRRERNRIEFKGEEER